MIEIAMGWGTRRDIRDTEKGLGQVMRLVQISHANASLAELLA
jgi:hypothetical protein